MTGLPEELRSFYKGRRVLVTGHTGFKGAWLVFWLRRMGAKTAGLALPPTSPLSIFTTAGVQGPDDTFGDIRNLPTVRQVINEFEPEVVFHLAAQAIVGTAFQDPQQTFDTNVMGTVNVLESIRMQPSVRAAVMVTSDKCYENVEQIWGYREHDRLGGFEPYGASKAAAEVAISSYVRSYFDHAGAPSIASARAGNVVGGGDWSEYRLIPDCIRSLRDGRPIQIRNPQATRPWQFVLEPLAGYLTLGMRLGSEGKAYEGAWNFGPSLDETFTVQQGADAVVDAWGSGSVELANTHEFRESTLLQLDCTKALRYLGWRYVMNFAETTGETVSWYRHQFESGDGNMAPFSCAQLEAFEARFAANAEGTRASGPVQVT